METSSEACQGRARFQQHRDASCDQVYGKFKTKVIATMYWGADKSLARPGRIQAQKHFRDTRDFNNIETRAVSKFLFLQGKEPKEIHNILTETLACFLPGRAKDLSAPLYFNTDSTV